MTGGVSAGLPRRLAALVYDTLLVAGMWTVFTFAAVMLTHGRAILGETVGGWVYLYRAGLAAIATGYFVLNWVRTGQTLGMRAWHLVLTDASGRRPRPARALLRAACAVPAWGLAALGVLWLYADPQRLALHDRLSGTRLLHVLPGS